VRFLAPNWNLIYQGLVDVASKIKSSGEEFDAIVGIARGGWIPARILSDFLGVKRLISMQVSSYQGLTKKAVKSLDEYRLAATERKILLVDDVADTRSLLLCRQHRFRENRRRCPSTATYSGSINAAFHSRP